MKTKLTAIKQQWAEHCSLYHEDLKEKEWNPIDRKKLFFFSEREFHETMPLYVQGILQLCSELGMSIMRQRLAFTSSFVMLAASDPREVKLCFEC